MASDKVLRDKTFAFSSNAKYDGYQCGLASIVWKIFDKKAGQRWITIISEDQQLADELHRTITKKVHSSYWGNIWGADLADMQLMTKCNKEVRFSLFLFTADIPRFFHWKRKSITNTIAYLKILDEFRCKPNKIWVDRGGEYYKRSMKSWLHDNGI